MCIVHLRARRRGVYQCALYYGDERVRASKSVTIIVVADSDHVRLHASGHFGALLDLSVRERPLQSLRATTTTTATTASSTTTAATSTTTTTTINTIPLPPPPPPAPYRASVPHNHLVDLYVCDEFNDSVACSVDSVAVSVGGHAVRVELTPTLKKTARARLLPVCTVKLLVSRVVEPSAQSLTRGTGLRRRRRRVDAHWRRRHHYHDGRRRCLPTRGAAVASLTCTRTRAHRHARTQQSIVDRGGVREARHQVHGDEEQRQNAQAQRQASASRHRTSRRQHCAHSEARRAVGVGGARAPAPRVCVLTRRARAVRNSAARAALHHAQRLHAVAPRCARVRAVGQGRDR